MQPKAMARLVIAGAKVVDHRLISPTDMTMPST